MKFRVVVLASGRGSNFMALANAVDSGLIPNAEIVSLVSNKKEAGALEIAKEKKIPTHVVESALFKTSGKFDRKAFEEKLLQVLVGLRPDWICLAGYMLLLGQEVVQKFPGKIINIHPSLLPKYKGLHAQAQALAAGEKETGCTVHFVTEALDDGPVIVQAKVPILSGDTEESLSQRLLPIEHKTYCEALKRLCEGKK